MCGGSVDFHYRETHAIVNVAGLCNVVSAARLLFPKLVTREAKHHQTLSSIFFVECFKSAVLWCKTAMAGCIDDENNLIGVVFHRDKLVIKTSRYQLVKEAHIRVLKVESVDTNIAI